MTAFSELCHIRHEEAENQTCCSEEVHWDYLEIVK